MAKLAGPFTFLFLLIAVSFFVYLITKKNKGFPLSKCLSNILAALLGFDLIILLIFESIKYLFIRKVRKDNNKFICCPAEIIYSKCFYGFYYLGIAIYLSSLYIFVYIPWGSEHNYVFAIISLVLPILLIISTFYKIGDRKLYFSDKQKRLFIGFLSLRKFNDFLRDPKAKKDRNSFYVIIEIFVIFIFAIISFGWFYFSIFNIDNSYFHDATNICINQRRFFDFIYFSFVTASSVGYGDLVPTGLIPKIVVIVQIILSWITISVGIASAVSLRD